MTDPQTTADLFARHGSFVRSLARELSRCEADAEDLAQETWTEALVRPPREWSSPRGWLGRVTHRLAGKRGRGDRRRAARHEVAARPERIDAQADHAVALQELVQVLMTLDDASRRLVTARHFEGLELRALARREGLGLTTVKQRLARAHAELRVRLDARHDGDRSRWLAALAPLVGPPTAPVLPNSPATASPTGPLVTGTLIMSAPLKLSIAAVVVVAAAYGFSSLRGDDVSLAVTPALQKPEAEELVSADLGLAPEEERRNVDAPNTTLAVTDPEPEFDPALATLEVIVTDLDRIPASGVNVFAAPAGQPLNRMGKTDQEGQLTIRWHPGATADLVVGLKARGAWIGGLRRIAVPAGGRRAFEASVHGALLPDRSASVIQGIMVGSNLRLSQPGNAQMRFAAVAGAENLTFRVDGGSELWRSRNAPPSRRRGPLYAEPVAGQGGGTVFSAHGLGWSGANRTGNNTFNLSLFSSENSGLNPENSGVLEGTVSDHAGLPAAQVIVRAREVADEPQESTAVTDADGHYELRLPPGDYQLRAGSPQSGGAEKRVSIAIGQRTTWEPFVDRGLALAGEVEVPGSAEKDETNNAGPPVLVEAFSATARGSWIGVAPLGEKGSFVIPHCPSQIVTVNLSRRDVAHGLPAMHFDAVAAGGEPWRAKFEPKLVAVTGTPGDDAEGVLIAGELRVWDAAGSRGAQISVRGEIGSPVEFSLPLGSWTLALGTHGPGWSAAVPIDLLGDKPLDLGVLPLAPVGWLDLEAPPEGHTWHVLAQLPGGSELHCYQGKGGAEEALEEVPLPQGTYRVLLINDETADSEEIEIIQARTARHVRLAWDGGE